MKTQVKAASLIAAVIFGASIVSAQTPPPPPQPPVVMQPANGIATPPAPPPPPMVNQPLQEVTAFTGKVVKLVANDDYVYDGLYMLNGSDSLLVKFPPHMGAQIIKAASVGSSITVNGVSTTSPLNEKEIRMVSITANGNTFLNEPPATNATPAAETSVTGSGKVSSLQTNREGIVTGYILDNNTVLRIPPHAANQLASLARQSSSVTYTGNKKVVNNGEAAAGTYTIVHCKTLTINGKQYLVE